MTQRTSLLPRDCPNCDGFASAAISTGGRDQCGHFHTITADCPACHGTGTRTTRRNREGARV
ncbi:hypothetical protein QFW82_29850 [Streptomyces malaysiensis subsp. malaysiensis]|uniref:hypothetical protein n=1 Tax=Streptomyces malaysiensis TaxID=92644 RepID=UPI0024C099CA|nr:hypothetical protein [Streptomyces sp. NA07423]WHX20944.1 hypothetical protein QFW82_29850 [Streptomyces sp. NA07423]